MPKATENKSLIPLSIAALGIIYGDIGTSPLLLISCGVFRD